MNFKQYLNEVWKGFKKLSDAEKEALDHSKNISDTGKTVITKDKDGFFHVHTYMSEEPGIVAKYQNGKKVTEFTPSHDSWM